MDFLGDIFGLVLSGGATGLLGTVISGGIGLLNKMGERKEKAADRAHELALQRLQMERGDRETENELAIISAQTEGAALQASYSHDTALNAPSWVDAIRGLMRPFLTAALLGLTAYFFVRIIGGSFDRVVDGVDLVSFIVMSIVFSTTTAITWWFGDRAVSKTLQARFAK